MKMFKLSHKVLLLLPKFKADGKIVNSKLQVIPID